MSDPQTTLILEVLYQDTHVKMGFYEQHESFSTIKSFSQRRISLPEISGVCSQVSDLLAKANYRGLNGTETCEQLKKLGHVLWDGLFSAQVKERLQTAQANSLTITFDEELIAIPWELLYDGSEFLCLKFAMGRLVRTRSRQRPIPRYRPIASPLKMLILADPTGDLPCAYSEGVFVKEHFQHAGQACIDFKSSQISSLYVKKYLRDYDLVHFSGHCHQEGQGAGQPGWVFSDGVFGIRDILAMGEASALPSLVFSNGCQSAQPLVQEPPEAYQYDAYSLACAFLFSGVRHYVGTVRKIEDQVSRMFAIEFYRCLFAGGSVGQSMHASRMKVCREYGPAAVFWASYILYGDPSFVLVNKRSLAPARRKAVGCRHWKLTGRAALLGGIAAAVFMLSWLPVRQQTVYGLYAQSQKMLDQGRNQEAIAVCASIIAKSPTFLEAYPVIGQAYTRLGKRGEALRSYFDYARQCSRKGMTVQEASAYVSIGWVYHQDANYPKAYEFYEKAIRMSRESSDKLNEARALRKLAVWHMDRQENDKALELLTKSSEINRERVSLAEHRYNLACDYFDMGLVFANKDDLPAAKEFYGKSMVLFEKLNAAGELSDYYFNLGEICLFEKRYQQALENYRKGLALDTAQGNIPSMVADYTMIGELYEEMNDPAKARDYYRQAEQLAQRVEVVPELAQARYNLGMLCKKERKHGEARGYLASAVALYEQLGGDQSGEVRRELDSLEQNGKEER